MSGLFAALALRRRGFDVEVFERVEGELAGRRAGIVPQPQIRAPLYAGYVAWRALIPEGAVSPSTHRDLFEYLAFCHPPGEQVLGYPVAGPGNDLRAGHRGYNFVWYRPADEDTELPRLLTDAA